MSVCADCKHVTKDWMTERARCIAICAKLNEEYRQKLRAANESNFRDMAFEHRISIRVVEQIAELIRGEETAK